MNTVYVIGGTAGEYSDSVEWVVCWTDSEDEAKAIVREYDRRSRELMARLDDEERLYGERPEDHPWDPQWRCSYVATSYFYSKCHRYGASNDSQD